LSVSYGKGFKGKATKLHSVIIRSLGHCENCDYVCPCIDKWKHTIGCKLQAAHLEGRTASGTRTQLRNAYCLDASCHRKFTDKPLTFAAFVDSSWAAEYKDRLVVLSRPMTTGQKMDWEEELVRLKAMHDDLKNNRLTIKEAREIEHDE